MRVELLSTWWLNWVKCKLVQNHMHDFKIGRARRASSNWIINTKCTIRRSITNYQINKVLILHSCCYLAIIIHHTLYLYYTDEQLSFAFETEDGCSVIRNMFFKLKTVCYYLKIISCLLLFRKLPVYYIHIETTQFNRPITGF